MTLWALKRLLKKMLKKTLQKLLAPKSVDFLTREEHLGSKETLEAMIYDMTDIPMTSSKRFDFSALNDNLRVRCYDYFCASTETTNLHAEKHPV